MTFSHVGTYSLHLDEETKGHCKISMPVNRIPRGLHAAQSFYVCRLTIEPLVQKNTNEQSISNDIQVKNNDINQSGENFMYHYFTWAGSNPIDSSTLSIPRHQLIDPKMLSLLRNYKPDNHAYKFGARNHDNQVEDTNQWTKTTAQIGNSYSMYKAVHVEISCDPLDPISEIYLQPLTKTDWDIVSTQAALIEDVFIRQFAIVYKTQHIRVILSPSLHADFAVDQINIGNQYSVGNTLGDHNVGRITERTRLVISPVTSSDSNSNKSMQYWRNVQSNTKHLRLLPQKFRNMNTSYMKNTQEISLSEDIDELSRMVDDMFPGYGTSDQVRVTTNIDDICSYVNNLDYASMVLSNKERKKQDTSYLGLISLKDFDSMDVQPSQSCTLLPIRPSSAIRYGHISISKNARIILGTLDYAMLEVRLIDLAKLPLRRPIKIEFYAVIYDAIDPKKAKRSLPGDIQDKSQDSDKIATEQPTTDGSIDISSSILQYRLKYNQHDALPLVDGSIVTLSVPMTIPGEGYEDKDFLIRMHFEKRYRHYD